MNDPEIREPDHSTVEDWEGQNIARDQEAADRALAENDSVEEAEEQFEQEAEGEERYREGYPRPDDEPEASGAAVGREGSE